MKELRESIGLYDSSYEHDNCGIGAVVNIKGIKTHETVNNALKIVENLEHRAGKDAEGKMVLVFFSRYPTSSSARQFRPWDMILEMRESTALVCSSSLRRSFRENRP